MSMIEIALREIDGKNIPAVTSIQVAKHFEKEHYNVLRDIESVLSQVPENFVKLNFECYEYPVETGIGTRTAKAYLLSKDAFTLLTMGYTGEKAMAFKIAYIARFNEMEEQLRTTSPLLPNFRDPIAAAEAWIVAERARLAEQARADYYQRTKAEIGSRREATAMATASAAVRKAAALENELGRGRDYKSVKGIPWFLDVFADTPAAYSVAGRKLSDMSRRMDYEIREIEDSRFGSVKAYHVDVIEAFRLALKNDLNMMRKYLLRRAA